MEAGKWLVGSVTFKNKTQKQTNSKAGGGGGGGGGGAIILVVENRDVWLEFIPSLLKFKKKV